MTYRSLWLLAALLLLTGCSTLKGVIPGGDKADEPAPLTEISASADLEKQWKKASGEIDDASRLIQPVLAGGTVFAVSSQGRVIAVDAESGETLWTRDLDLRVTAGVGYGDALAFVGSAEGDVIALNASDGSIAWHATVDGEVLASPMASQGVVVVPNSTDRLTGISTVDGSKIWGLRESTPRLSLRGRGRPLAVSDVALAGFEDGKLLLIRLANGQILWDVTVGDAVGKSELDRLADVDTRPLLVGDIVYAAAYHSRVVAIHAPSSRIVWEYNISTYQDISADDDHVYATDENNVVVAIDRQTGLMAWQQKSFANRGVSAPTVVGDYVVVGDKEGYLHLLDSKTGELVGRTRVDGAVASQPLVQGATVIVQTVKGALIALSVVPK